MADLLENAFKSWGLDHTGRNRNHASGGVFGGVPTFLSTFLFMFYVMIGGNPFFVVLADSFPIIEHESSTTAPADAALEALFKRGLVRPGTGKPTVIHSINSLFGRPVINFVQVDEAALVPPGHSLFGSKVYSFVDPRTGKTLGGKDASIPGLGPAQYAEMLAALLKKLSSAPPPSLAGFERGGGSGGGDRTAHVPASVAGRGGGGLAESLADRSRLTKVLDMTPSVKNSFAMLILASPKGGILLVRTIKDMSWGLPGGKRRHRETPFKCAGREFEEEINCVLPSVDGSDFGTDLNEPVKFEWAHHHCASGIYCGKSSVSFSEFHKRFMPNDEICEIGVFTPQQILQMARGLDPNNKLRECALCSTITILLHLGLIV